MKYLFLIYASLVACLYSVQSLSSQNIVLTLNSTTKEPLSTASQDGFLDLIAKEALGRLGVKLKTTVLPAERALIDANAGILDGELSRVPGIDKIYTNLLFIPESLLDLEFTVFSINKTSIEPGWKGLENSSVSFLNGWKILEINVPNTAEIIKSKTPTQLFNLLKLDRVDYIIYERWSGTILAKSMNIKGVTVLQPPLAVRGMHIYLHKKHRELVAPLTQVIKTIKQDGTYQKIYNQKLKAIVE